MVKEIVGTELGLTNNNVVHNKKTSSEMVGFFYVLHKPMEFVFPKFRNFAGTSITSAIYLHWSLT
jgi:hypothetical protein